MDFEDISLQNVDSASCINYPQGLTGYWGKCLTAAALFHSLSTSLAQCQWDFFFNSMIAQWTNHLSYSAYQSLIPSPFLSLPFISPCWRPVCLASPLISLPLNLVLWLSLQPCPPSPSVPPLYFPLYCSELKLPRFFFFYPSSLIYYLLISPSPSWTPDLKTVLATLEGGGGLITGARMHFSASCLWSKALSTVKADPSVIYNLLQYGKQSVGVFS